ncbi:MAG: ATP-binding cassette domain-containing protein, partial [Burkholderiales bacterium]
MRERAMTEHGSTDDATVSETASPATDPAAPTDALGLAPRAVGIRLDAVSKRFRGGVEAIRDCSLTVEPGEFMVLVGPSGCGKSTLLRIIA